MTDEQSKTDQEPSEAEQRDRELVVPLTEENRVAIARMAGDVGRRQGGQA